MKNMLPLIVTGLSFVLLLSSCNKETNPFLGNWELSEFRLDCPSEGLNNFSLEADSGCMEFQDEKFCLSISFENESEGNLSIGETLGSSEMPFTYTIAEGSEIANICLDGGDCEQLELRDGRIILEESDPKCPAEYLLRKR